MMRAKWIVAGAVVLLAAGAWGEVPNRTPEELDKGASHIVTGELKTFYRSVTRDAQYEQTQGLAELVVDKVEKGDGLRPGQTVFLRYWNQRWIGKGSSPPGASGHHLPPAGKRVRAHVEQREDGTFEVLLPNGINEPKR